MSSKKDRYEEEMGSSDHGTGKVVVVAVRASRDISSTALVWALTHVVQPGDCIKLLVVIPPLSSSIHCCHSLFSFNLSSILNAAFYLFSLALYT